MFYYAKSEYGEEAHDKSNKILSNLKKYAKGYVFSLPQNRKRFDDRIATKLKEIGNNFYKEGNYEKAVEQYKEALTYLPPSETKVFFIFYF